MIAAIASGKGGTGKTTIATNLARVVSEAGRAVRYVDCDVEEPNGQIFLKPEILERRDVTVQIPRVDPAQAITPEPMKIGEIEIGKSRDVDVVTGMLQIGFAATPALIREVKKRIGPEGMTILDVRPGTSCPVATSLRGADFVVLVTAPEASHDESTQEQRSDREDPNTMRIAIPLTDGVLSPHFGHCEQFAIVDIDREDRQIRGQELVTPPAHEPGLLPKWLSGMQVNLVIAGGMGQRAQQLFAEHGIEVLCGAPTAKPEELVVQHVEGRLELGHNTCDH